MLKYTICFIRRGSKILMLNREYSPLLGIWNGVGGKMEEGESPSESIIREVYEETGIQLDNVIEKGRVTWTVDGTYGGMYAFIANLPEDFSYETPRKTEEGILEWKEISWVLDSSNLGIASNIPFFLPKMLNEDTIYDHLCTYENGILTKFVSIELTSEYA